MEQDEHIPALVEDWTWDTIVHVVKKHEFEPSLYDFKDVLHPTGDQAHRDRHIRFDPPDSLLNGKHRRRFYPLRGARSKEIYFNARGPYQGYFSAG